MAIKNLVMFSGGVGSWAAAKRVADRHGTDGLVLLFADTKIEDEDLYRFIGEAADNVGGELVTIADGRTPWDLFFDEKMMGSSHADLCSRMLKRELLDDWRKENCDDNTVTHFGIDWTEKHRFDGIKKRHAPWKVSAPMCEKPYLTKQGMLRWLDREGIERPRLYDLGFPHNNCGGFCVKAGQGHFIHLLKTMPERYAEHEQKEREFREMTGKDVSILRDRRGGETNPLTLEELRKRHESNRQLDLLDWGGCGCAVE